MRSPAHSNKSRKPTPSVKMPCVCAPWGLLLWSPVQWLPPQLCLCSEASWVPCLALKVRPHWTRYACNAPNLTLDHCVSQKGFNAPNAPTQLSPPSGGVCFALKGLIFNNDRRRSIACIIFFFFLLFFLLSRLLHGYLPKRKKKFTWCVFLQFIRYQHSQCWLVEK